MILDDLITREVIRVLNRSHWSLKQLPLSLHGQKHTSQPQHHQSLSNTANMSRAHTIGRRPKLTLDTSLAPPRSQPYEIIAPTKFARTTAHIRPVSGAHSLTLSYHPQSHTLTHIFTDRDLETLVRAFEKMATAASSDEWESTLGALKKLLRERAGAREKEKNGLGLFGDGKAARSGREVEGMVGEWMEGMEDAWVE